MGNVNTNVQSAKSLQTDLLPRTSSVASLLTSRDVFTSFPCSPTSSYIIETKGHYRRDDPSFAVLLSFLLCIAALAWGLAYSPGFLSILKLMVFMVGVDFALVGLLIAALAWFLARRFLKGRRTVGIADVIAGGVGATAGLGGEELEFGYCFDVHCNAFFPVFVLLYVAQFIVMPLLIKDLWYSSSLFVLANPL